MELSKIQICKLDGNNWIQWKYRMSALLRGMDGLFDIILGKLQKPKKPVAEIGDPASAAALMEYNKKLSEYVRLESTALLLVTNNISDEILDMVIRFSHPKDVWDELHRLYDGVNEDKLYDVCMEFFKFQKDTADDMATYVSKLKNMWHKLNQELLKAEESKQLPEILLICKILDTLPESYFSFKSSWMLMSKKDRTVENITSQLCAHERALIGNMEGTSSEALLTNTRRGVEKNKEQTSGNKKVTKIRCHFCKEVGHFRKDCPTKTSKEDRGNSCRSTNMMILLNTTECNEDRERWFVDNGATHHVTMRRDLFENFEHFSKPHTVTTADGNEIEALGKGSIRIKPYVGKEFFLSDVWLVPCISKNLFSVLATQDKNTNSVFESRVTTCSIKVNGIVAVTGTRTRYGGLYKLNCVAIKPERAAFINAIDTLQLYHERMGHQDKRHVKSLIERELNIKAKDNGILCEGCIFGKAHRQKFGVREKAKMPGERIHSDVCGPFPSSVSKYRYFVLFKDEHTRFRYVYFMKAKSEVPEKLKQMLAEARVAGHTIREFLSDNGGEFDNELVRKELSKYGIHQRLIMPYTPEQNKCSERENRTFVVS